jgi:hypothetical protein
MKPVRKIIIRLLNAKAKAYLSSIKSEIFLVGNLLTEKVLQSLMFVNVIS